MSWLCFFPLIDYRLKALKYEINKVLAKVKLNKFINENALLNQDWIMEPKKKVKDIIREVAGADKIEIMKFIRFKVGEGL